MQKVKIIIITFIIRVHCLIHSVVLRAIPFENLRGRNGNSANPSHISIFPCIPKYIFLLTHYLGIFQQVVFRDLPCMFIRKHAPPLT